MGSDFWLVFEWWASLFLFGAFAYPLTKRLFAGWYDRGYLFAKAVGLAAVTFVIYLVGSLRLFPFTQSTILASLGVVFLIGILLQGRSKSDAPKHKRILAGGGKFIVEELFFFLMLFFWAWIKGHQPAIRELEKFMDFGFTKSVLNSRFFPAPDMWYAGGSINYYYFGHITMAVLTKFSGIDLAYTFNFMLASIFAFTITMSASIGYQLGVLAGWTKRKQLIGSFLTAFLVTLGGNLQTIYAFTRGYTGDNVKPFWELGWSLNGLTNYWYANATRFIPFSIHEFPSYSFVVSDVHGHVLSLPFVLLAIALLVGIMGERRESAHWPKQIGKLMFYGFLVGVLLMTNALDGPIYLGLFVVTLGVFLHPDWKKITRICAVVIMTAGLTILPFLLHFKSFVSGIALNCPPAFLQLTKVGPLLFEGVEKCQRSPLWMLLLLWGFFLYCGAWFLGKWRLGTKRTQIDKLLLVLFVFSISLITFPEFLYFKDIYPMHFRSNTMFKLGYEAFILFSIVSAYAIMTVKHKLFYVFLVPLLFLVSIYPYFSVRSYFNNLSSYEGLYGLSWLAREYPHDYAGINWLNQHVKDAVIVEADGDSYTDYARFSTFTGLPTIIGWPVHEWLWRGTYDVVAPRREDVATIYESEDMVKTRQLLNHYHAQYVVVGALERKKYTNLNEAKFRLLGSEVFRSGQTVIYHI